MPWADGTICGPSKVGQQCLYVCLSEKDLSSIAAYMFLLVRVIISYNMTISENSFMFSVMYFSIMKTLANICLLNYRYILGHLLCEYI